MYKTLGYINKPLSTKIHLKDGNVIHCKYVSKVYREQIGSYCNPTATKLYTELYGDWLLDIIEPVEEIESPLERDLVSWFEFKAEVTDLKTKEPKIETITVKFE